MKVETVKNLETDYYDVNWERCAHGIKDTIATFSQAVADWDIPKMEEALQLWNWWTSEFESVMQRVHDEAQEAQEAARG
jgi:hypothetical protein